MVRALAASPDARVAGIASRSPGRASQLASREAPGTPTGDYGWLLERQDVDLVYVANRTAEHAATAIECLEAGKHVVCEKPLATSLHDAQAVVAKARQRRCFLMEAIWTLCLPSHRAAVDAVRRGAAGPVVSLSADFGYPLALGDAANRTFLADSGGVLYDRAIYPVALALSALGPASATQVQACRVHDGVLTHVELSLRHAQGVVSHSMASFVARTPNRAAFACQAGVIELEPPLLGSEAVRIQGERPQVMAVADLSEPRGARRLADMLRSQPGARHLKRLLQALRAQRWGYGSNPYHPMWSHVARCLEQGATESEWVPLELSLQLHRVLDDAAHGCAQDTDTRGEAA